MIKTQHTDFIFELDDFLSINECLTFIEQSEAEGFTSADVQLEGARSLLSDIRNNERLNYFSEELAVKFWKRLSETDFPEILCKKAIGISPYFRFYKYYAGQKFNMHKDGRQSIGNNKTLCTLLIYLNHNYLGGNTEFRTNNLIIRPKIGSALCFEHHEWHKGCTVDEGVKYVLRTDVVYAS